MKKSKEYVGIVLTFIVTLMLVGMISGTVKAENIRSGEYEYSLSSGDATIEKYLGSATDVIIPSTIDGYEVKGIDYDAFLNSKISKVTIPEGITRIRFEAFKNCESLSTVNFNAVNCEGTVSPVFAGCKNLKTINIGSKVTLIGSYMFANVPAENIVLPTSVKEIDNDAFANSGVKSVTIPEGITRIRFEAFKNCESLSTVNFNAVNCEGTVSPVFAGCKNLKTINIGSKVTLIGSYMFANVPAENIVLPTSVKEIDYDAFANSELKSITIPENVQNISFEVFKGCKNFKDIYYGGSKQGWLKIRISDNNKELKNATIHFAKIQVQPSKVLKANKKKKAKKVKIKILKVASSYGYRVQVSTTKNFKKKILDKKVKKCSFTLSNSKLKKKKKIYVRVQNSQLYNGKVLNSSWSKAYKVKIK
ncbi:leucine-rich repeat domain-containing protein [uncultured Eubacterium sp.]|nr:leucine-rich repeat domain-containing protein [uncultured Eubacterium sp.]